MNFNELILDILTEIGIIRFCKFVLVKLQDTPKNIPQ
jgi:hypothetical protein